MVWASRSYAKKSRRTLRPSGFGILRTYARLVFNFNVLNHTCLACAGVIHLHAILRRQRSANDVAGAVDDPHWSLQRERNWTLALVFHHDGFARLIRCYDARRICRAGRCRCCRHRGGCLFSGGCLRECKWCNCSTSQSNNEFLHCVFPSLCCFVSSTKFAWKLFRGTSL